MRILFTGGMTGGHIYPIVSVAGHVMKAVPDVRMHYIGVPGQYRQLLESNGISVARIVSAKLRRGEVLRNIIDLPFLAIAIMQALWRVFWIMPDVLFSKGGPGALPVVLACAFYQIPIVIHESDSVAGVTSLASARFAERIGIAYATAKDSFMRSITGEAKRAAMEHKIALIGNPVRDIFFTAPDMIDTATAKKLLDFDSQKPLLFVIGGSQGALRVNEFFLSIAEELLNRNVQVLHQTGFTNAAQAKGELETIMRKYSANFHNAYRIVPYFEENLKDAYLAADIVISRSGSGSIFEIAAMGRPAILIPLPESISRDQVKNAFEYASTGAAITIEEANLTKNIFFTQLDKMLADTAGRAAMSAAAKSFARPDAAKMLAAEIIRLGQRG